MDKVAPAVAVRIMVARYASRVAKYLSRRVIVSLVLLLLLAPSLVNRAASPWRRLSVQTEAGINDLPSTNGVLRIACFNIAHGRGTADSNWDGGSADQRRDRLRKIAETLIDLDADVVILNEVDFDSSWSHSVNQAEFLAEKAGYRYRAEQRNIDARLLAWKWKFGNAILSRVPIENARVVPFPGYSSWETMFAGKKRGLCCDLRVGKERVCVVASHLCHRSENVRARSAIAICDSVQQSSFATILAGDMNSSPPGFPHSLSDANGRNAMAIYDESGLFRRSTNSESSIDSMTFPAHAPTRVIDWILIPKHWRYRSYQTVPTDLSDHRAVVADIGLSRDSESHSTERDGSSTGSGR